MSDNYQAVYDAVRSQVPGCDTSSVLTEAAARAFDISHVTSLAVESITSVSNALTRPSAVYRPKLTKDGDMWIALYGSNLQSGVCGCGETPEKAMAEFDKAWYQG